jgi:hypothetical protein
MAESCPATCFGPHLVFCQASRAIPGSLPRPRLGVAPPAECEGHADWPTTGECLHNRTAQKLCTVNGSDLPAMMRSEMTVRAASRDHADAARARRYHVHCTVVPAYFFSNYTIHRRHSQRTHAHSSL